MNSFKKLRASFYFLSILIALPFNAQAAFDECSFNFGRAWDGAGAEYTGVDYITIWAGSYGDGYGNNFNPYWHGAMIEKAEAIGATPVYVAYLIPFLARQQAGLQDCNVGTPSLCQQGANFIRSNWSPIVAHYKKYAADTKAKLSNGAASDMIWLMEPDFVQYAANTQSGGGLSYDSLATLMGQIVSAIHSELPNARISLDISAWIDQSVYLPKFQNLNIKFMNTSGGESEPEAKIRSAHDLTWASVFSLTGRNMIGDTGYGVGGGSTGHNSTWDDVAKLNARIADGVIAITQANPKSNWSSTIASIRPQLNSIPACSQSSSSAVSSSSEVSSSSSVLSSSSEVSSSSSVLSSSSEDSSSAVSSSSEVSSSSSVLSSSSEVSSSSSVLSSSSETVNCGDYRAVFNTSGQGALQNVNKNWTTVFIYGSAPDALKITSLTLNYQNPNIYTYAMNFSESPWNKSYQSESINFGDQPTTTLSSGPVTGNFKLVERDGGIVFVEATGAYAIEFAEASQTKLVCEQSSSSEVSSSSSMPSSSSEVLSSSSTPSSSSEVSSSSSVPSSSSEVSSSSSVPSSSSEVSSSSQDIITRTVSPFIKISDNQLQTSLEEGRWEIFNLRGVLIENGKLIDGKVIFNSNQAKGRYIVRIRTQSQFNSFPFVYKN